jgi:hypothetical protein
MRALDWLGTKRAFWRVAQALRPRVLARAIR